MNDVSEQYEAYPYPERDPKTELQEQLMRSVGEFPAY